MTPSLGIGVTKEVQPVMVSNRVNNALGKRSLAVLGAAFLAGILAQTAAAADCPGHPDALGTSRTLVVDPREHPRIGTMQYGETLPLDDHEVVLTFDDGPLPKYSNQILDILASQCVKATFFVIGQQANANPASVRKLVDAGHTVGTHSQTHPLTFNRMSIEKAKPEVDQGIASTLGALGDASKLAPFFRIPGLLRAEAVEDYLASQGIQTWSADFLADDWRHVSPARVYDLAIQRIEAKGKGILLLHDIQPRTVAALPRILQELKVRGYRIVHVVPATPDRPATPTEPSQWMLHPPSETVAISRWPKVPNFVFAASGSSSVPISPDQWWHTADLFYRAPRAASAVTQWPPTMFAADGSRKTDLPIPSATVFNTPENLRLTLLGSHHLQRPAARGYDAGAQRLRHATRHAQAGHRPRTLPGHAALTNPNGRAVRVATLKKR